MNPERLDLAREAIEVCNGPQLAVTMPINLAVMAKLGAELLAEVDRLTRELADCEAHLIGARRDFEAASKSMLERHETELAERTRDLKTVQSIHALVRTVVNEHRGECGAGTDVAGDIELAFLQLAERTRERDDAKRMYCVATALQGTDAITCDDVGLLRSIAASTWCGAEARRLYPEEPRP